MENYQTATSLNAPEIPDSAKYLGLYRAFGIKHDNLSDNKAGTDFEYL